MKKLISIAISIITIFIVHNTHRAFGGAVISSGPISMGIFDEGNLGFNGVGLSFDSVGDAIMHGCPCEGWGVSGNGTDFGFADQSMFQLELDSFSSTATTATSIVHLTTLPELQITQAYAPSLSVPSSLFEDKVTITNTGSTDITDVRYSRAMDWDVPPNPFQEYVTIGGLPSINLQYSSDNGIGLPIPLLSGGFIDASTVNVNFTDHGPGDYGAIFTFGFGALSAGSSKTFSIFYGATANELTAMNALTSVGAEVYSLGQSTPDGTPATYIFGYKGPASSVPEPSSLVLLSSGIAGLIGLGSLKHLF